MVATLLEPKCNHLFESFLRDNSNDGCIIVFGAEIKEALLKMYEKNLSYLQPR